MSCTRFTAADYILVFVLLLLFLFFQFRSRIYNILPSQTPKIKQTNKSMFGGSKWFSRSSNPSPSDDLDYFSLPSPLPQWPPGGGFGTRRINLGEIEVCEIDRFEPIWCWNRSRDRKKGITFYRPERIPEFFYCLGHYCQSNDRPLRGFVLVAREPGLVSSHQPALRKPLDYTLMWSPEDGNGDRSSKGSGYFWFPESPEGYKAVGIFVTDTPNKPGLDDMRIVRADLTDPCEVHQPVLHDCSNYLGDPFRVWTTRPRNRGKSGRAVPVGTFFCCSFWNWSPKDDDLKIACLKNTDPSLHAMPNLDQIHALIAHYGPTIFFHPNEAYLPSSVSWFFNNGPRIHGHEDFESKAIHETGENLPVGGINDGKYWIELPKDDRVKKGDLETAELYVHVKPALGATFTDIAMWVFCPFNGPATLKVGLLNIGLSKIGQHVGDWEHVTLRVSNFTGELWQIYFSQHSSGEWIDACDLEFVEGNRAAVYSSRNGHACFPHPGAHIQGAEKLGIGIRNDAARSDLSVDSNRRYKVVSAEHLGDGVVVEPLWLQYMREWGPTVVYSSRAELDRLANVFPVGLRCSVKNTIDKLPLELHGERGPTGPKAKHNWLGDEAH